MLNSFILKHNTPNILRKLSLLFCAMAALACASFAQKPLSPLRFSKNIKAEHLKEYLYKLASDEFEGRETGQKGQKEAAAYIAAHFKNIGIPPLQNGTYFQDIPLLQKQVGETKFTIESNVYSFKKDFYFFSGFEDVNITTSNISFLGYGISDSAYNDYKTAAVAGKVVMVLNGEPKDENGNYLITGTKELSAWGKSGSKRKSYLAREKEASLLLIIDDSLAQNLMRYSHFIDAPTLNVAGAEPKKGIPTIYISTDIANEILSGSKSTVQLAKQKISKTKSPLTLDFTVPFSLNIKRKTDPIKAENVLGYLAGSDLKNELVVITAHYDHLGVDGKTIYYGADDDGSGTAAVMELAKAFAIAKKTGQGPRRSILFMTVAGEEKGLLGSQYYSENPAFPLSNTVADLNIDMIGRIDDKHKGNPNYIYIIGSDKLSTDLHKINEKANKTYTKLDLDYTYNDPKDPNRYYYRSDHYNFAKHNIPVIFYFNGVHADYHKPTDTVDKINFEKMEKITQLVFFTAWDLANRNSRIKVDIVNDFKGER